MHILARKVDCNSLQLQTSLGVTGRAVLPFLISSIGGDRFDLGIGLKTEFATTITASVDANACAWIGGSNQC